VLNLIRYLVVDYERSNFTVSQCLFDENVSENIVAILSPSNITSTGAPGLKTSALVGLSVAPAVLFGLLALLIFCLLRKHKRKLWAKSDKAKNSQKKERTKPDFEETSPGKILVEKDTVECNEVKEMDPGSAIHEMFDSSVFGELVGTVSNDLQPSLVYRADSRRFSWVETPECTFARPNLPGYERHLPGCGDSMILNSASPIETYQPDQKKVGKDLVEF